MWNEIDVVPMRASDRSATRQALRELGLLVAAALVAAILPLLG